MSPPCQPYTRGGKELDDEDKRAAGLLNLIKILPKLDPPPKYIFLENVVNFEKSRSRERLIKQLDEIGYEMNEHLVTPTQFGIPNDRARYYLSARLPLLKKTEKGKYLDNCKFYREPNFIEKVNESELIPLYNYREDLNTEEESKYHVPDEYILKRYKFRFEVALLHAFPIKYKFLNENSKAPDYTKVSKHGFSFPETMTKIQRYRALGNSLNVYVVAMLLKHVLFNYDNKDFQ
ncbi:S-adenosyl-L-methionine-dependent methyltransferase [Neocallimastix californiae]|uniref:tRNA (cytosine(38)-C(5))-methyltransferase n=1 Tax=Neocallimastix californiae TaxID=1754190 RepID=A0A1Y2CLS8_9FUNG|nr:S-adenosyl-L-methionine-dependent methyltransferase [Neocallimastix californiae]|eukprot:ORY47969.1 S-adenosyl-L-methionine-dependent methyltransferase [Neocallimastix californiae]